MPNIRSERPAEGVEHDIKVYPDAGHGFLNDHDPAELPLWVKAIAKLAAASYHQPSARDARRRIMISSTSTSSPDSIRRT